MCDTQKLHLELLIFEIYKYKASEQSIKAVFLKDKAN